MSETAQSIINDVAELVTKEPGLTRSSLRSKLHGDTARRTPAIDAAINAGLIHEQPIGRSEGVRSTQGVFPGRGESIQRPSASEIRHTREMTGLTQGGFAGRLGVSRTLIARWERGWQLPPPWTGERLREIELSNSQIPIETVPIETEQFEDFQNISSSELRELLHRAGWTAARLAKNLGVNPSTLCRWQRDQGLRGERAMEARRLLEHAYQGSREELLTVVKECPGISREQLTRGRLGCGGPVFRLLEELLAAGQIHERRHFIINAVGIRRAVFGLFTGVAPHERSMSGAELQRARKQAGWSRARLARRLRVSQTMIAVWEGSSSTIGEPRRGELVRILSHVPAAAKPFEDPRHTSTEELDHMTLQLIAANPGQLKSWITEELPGDIQRRWSSIRRLLAAAQIHETERVFTDASGRSFPRSVLFVGPAPDGVTMGGSELRELRRQTRWTREELAKAIGVSPERITHWERDELPIAEPWPEQLRAALRESPLRPTALTDAQIQELALSIIKENPGLTRTAVAERTKGDIRRRYAAIDWLISSGRVYRKQRPGNGNRVSILFLGSQKSDITR